MENLTKTTVLRLGLKVRIWVYGELIIICPKPYSIYLRGTLNPKPAPGAEVLPAQGIRLRPVADWYGQAGTYTAWAVVYEL